MINTLQHAKQEIQSLRHRNEILEAQMGVVEVFAAALGMKRNGSGAMAPDVVWELQKKIDEMMEPKKEANHATDQIR